MIEVELLSPMEELAANRVGPDPVAVMLLPGVRVVELVIAADD